MKNNRIVLCSRYQRKITNHIYMTCKITRIENIPSKNPNKDNQKILKEAHPDNKWYECD